MNRLCFGNQEPTLDNQEKRAIRLVAGMMKIADGRWKTGKTDAAWEDFVAEGNPI